MTTTYGPQSPSDNSFTKRMRFHHSWYRAKVLGVPCGTGPTANDTRKLGSMLRREDGAKGMNFLTPQIFEEAKKRVAESKGVVEEFRLKHNLLSSQPMCFNLFAPLIPDREMAATVLGEFLPGKAASVTRVAVEHAPEPKDKYLVDDTAFDAFVEYVRPGGKPGFIGIETKLTEPFSQHHYDGEQYRRWSRRVEAPWVNGSSPALADIRINQLWRDHLLAVSMLLQQDSHYAEGYFMLVRHPQDKHCEKAVGNYRELLKPEDESFIDCPLDRMVDVIAGAAREDEQARWIADFKRRYLDLELSEEEWEKLKRHD